MSYLNASYGSLDKKRRPDLGFRQSWTLAPDGVRVRVFTLTGCKKDRRCSVVSRGRYPAGCGIPPKDLMSEPANQSVHAKINRKGYKGLTWLHPGRIMDFLN